MKIMFDDADVGEPESFGFLGKRERVAKIVGAGFLIGPDVGKKLHAEFHATRGARPAAAEFAGGRIRSRYRWSSGVGVGRATRQTTTRSRRGATRSRRTGPGV